MWIMEVESDIDNFTIRVNSYIYVHFWIACHMTFTVFGD